MLNKTMFENLLNTVFYPANAVMDWGIHQHPVIGVGALLLTAAAYLGVIATPFMIKAHFNAKAMDRTLKKLDHSTTTAFRYAADEKAYNHFQKDAVKAANKIGRKLGNGLSYSSFDACAARHKDFDKSQTPIYTSMMVGKVSVPVQTGTITTYHPRISGYQADRNNPEIAVPLYSSIHDGKGFREDGKLIDFSLS